VTLPRPASQHGGGQGYFHGKEKDNIPKYAIRKINVSESRSAGLLSRFSPRFFAPFHHSRSSPCLRVYLSHHDNESYVPRQSLTRKINRVYLPNRAINLRYNFLFVDDTYFSF
jgi:hypothetical protein